MTFIALLPPLMSCVKRQKTRSDRVNPKIAHDDAITIGGFNYGDQPGRFYCPQAVTVMHDGQVVVADSKNHRLQVFDAQLQFVRAIGEKGDQAWEFFHPRAVCCGRGEQRDTESGISIHDILVVADLDNKRVQMVSVLGHWVRAIPCPCDRPRGVCVGACKTLSSGAPNVYVSFESHRIVVFSWEGEFLHTFGSKGSLPGELCYPEHMCFDDEHEQLIVTEFGNHRVQVFSPSGESFYTFGSKGSDPAQFDHPSGVCLAGRGRLVVADTHNHRLCVYAWNGKHERLLATIGKRDQTPRKFCYPVGVCANTHGQLFVADSLRHRVVVIPSATDAREAFLACCMSERFKTGTPLTELAE